MPIIDKQIIHSVPSLNPRTGGIASVVSNLTITQKAMGAVRPFVVAQRKQGENLIGNAALENSIFFADANNFIDISLGISMLRLLTKVLAKGDFSIIHNHGLWHPANHWATRLAARNNIPLIIQPHGMLETWALKHKAWKKRFALALYQRSDISHANVILATSLEEYHSIRRFGFKQPIAVIPNGVTLPHNFDAQVIKNNSDNMRTVLFLSRVHPVKGLLNLIHAWKHASLNGWRLYIAGPSENEHIDEVLSLARALNVEDSIKYLGEVDGEKRSALYRHADLFVLPTYSENFGVVIAEALSFGVPVITTKGAPWSDLETNNCGWWIEHGIEPLIVALQSAAALSDLERHAMGRRGREYVKRYRWDDIAQQTSDLYSWILKKSEKPNTVIID
jgi:glycosyltransferase involved in cell wall biosynthesis